MKRGGVHKPRNKESRSEAAISRTAGGTTMNEREPNPNDPSSSSLINEVRSHRHRLSLLSQSQPPPSK